MAQANSDLLRLARHVLERGVPSSSRTAGRNIRTAYNLLDRIRRRIRDNCASPEELDIVNEYLGGAVDVMSRATLEGQAIQTFERRMLCFRRM